MACSRTLPTPRSLAGGLSLALLAVGGCKAVGPDYEPPEVETPDAWRNAVVEELETESSPLETWWHGLDDPTLDELIARAGESNLDLRVALARVDEARALRGIAAGEQLPAVEANASYDRVQLSENGLNPIPPGGFDPFNLETVGIAAAWELDVFGRIRRSVEAADAALAANVEDYRDVMVALYAEVASSYIDARSLQTRLAFARSNAEAQRESLQLTRDRYEAGLTSALDVAQAESNLANTEAEIPALESLLEFALNRLAVLLGEEPGAVHELLAEPAPIPDPPARVTAGMPADLLRRRPDMRRAERLLASQTALIGVATAEMYPRFSLTGALGLESTELSDLLDGDSLTWSVGTPVRWNLFAGGALRSAVEAEEARTEQALVAYEQTLLLALEEVENALASYRLERIRRERLAEGVDASQRAVDLVRTQYLSGLTNFQNLLDSQRSLFRQQDELAASEGRVVQSLIALNKALGGGWPLERADEQAREILTAAMAESSGEDGASDEASSPSQEQGNR
jgi:NodT family efflux transporter outer membrane factor (OMF) lipoprotein